MLLLTEFILTFLLMTAVFGTAVDERARAMKLGGFGIGLTVAFDILAAGPVTGASMNPARSFGPALVHGMFNCALVLLGGADRGGGRRGAALSHVLLEPEKNDVSSATDSRLRRACRALARR